MLADHWHFTFNLQYIGNVDAFGARRQNFTTAKNWVVFVLIYRLRDRSVGKENFL